jgi:hypothetical protein
VFAAWIAIDKVFHVEPAANAGTAQMHGLAISVHNFSVGNL